MSIIFTIEQLPEEAVSTVKYNANKFKHKKDHFILIKHQSLLRVTSTGCCLFESFSIILTKTISK
jgi:hypothetical protein